MGMDNVLHLQGGYGEWRKAGGPTGPRPEKKKGKG
jgi:3-mercaptopyruvate sulfurtransferase SseA